MNKTTLTLNNLPTFRSFLTHRREELKLSQRELARRVGVTHAIISRLESGISTDFKFSTFLGLAAALAVHPMVLVRLYEGEEAHESSLPADDAVFLEALQEFLAPVGATESPRKR